MSTSPANTAKDATLTRESMLHYFPAKLSHEQQEFRDLIIARLLGNTALPTLPASFVRLKDALDDPQCTVDDLLEILEADPGLVSKILVISKSAYYGSGEVDSLEHAIMRIGFKEVRRIAVAGGLVKMLSDFEDGVDWSGFWVRSIVVARLSDLIGLSFQGQDGSYYLAGLLHDVGRLFLRHHFPERYKQVTDSTLAHGGAYQAEEAIFGFTRGPISALLCRKWDLEARLTEAIQYHWHPAMHFGSNISPPPSAGFLALALDVSVALADLSGLGMTESDSGLDDYQQLPSYKQLISFPMNKPLDLNLEMQIAKAKDMVGSLAS